jgi:hypothetical protein
MAESLTMKLERSPCHRIEPDGSIEIEDNVNALPVMDGLASR